MSAAVGRKTRLDTVAESARKKAYLHVVVPLFLVSIIAYLDRVNIAFAGLTMNKQLGFTSEIFGFGAGIFFIGYFVFEIPGAVIAERWSPRKWLARIMITWGLAAALMAFVQTPIQFYVVRFLLGVAEASLYPVIYASVMPRWFSSRDRAAAIAVLLTSMQMSSVIGGPLAGWLLGISINGLAGWQALFLVEAVPAIVVGVILAFWIVDWPKDANWLSDEEKAFLARQYQQEVSIKRADKTHTAWSAMGDPEVLRLVVIYFLWITGFWGFSYWMPTVLKALSGWSVSLIGNIVVVPFVISLLTTAYIGYSSSKRGEKRIHGALPLFVAAVGIAVSAWTGGNAVLALLLVIVTAAGVYGPFGVWWSYPTTFLSGEAAASGSALINSFGNLGGFVGPFLVGFIESRSGSFVGSYMFLAVCLLAASLLMLTLKRTAPGAVSAKPAEATS